MDRSSLPASTQPGNSWFLNRCLIVGAAGRNAGGIGAGHLLLALAMLALGVRGFAYADFASVWQRIPIAHLPARQFFVYACASIELIAGIGLLVRGMVRGASAVLFVFLLLWAVLLKLPAVIVVPQMEATWLGLGEITVILAGGWILFAQHAGGWTRSHLRGLVGVSGVRWARLLFALSLPAIGLSHFVYASQTVGFIPAWMPWPYHWAYLTGAGSIATALAIVFAVFPRLAATLEAAMLSVITLLVWLPGVIAAPSSDDALTPFLMSSAIACGAWVVADSYRGIRWFTIGPSPRT